MATTVRKAPFSGWTMAGIGLVCYGFGVSPGYYSWGFFAPEVIAELGLSRQQIGNIFGIFSLVMSMIALFAGYAINRWGVRAIVTVGSLIAAVGFFMLSRAQSAADLYWSFAVVAAIGLGMSTVLPALTLAIQWFEKYRARATAIIMVGGALVGVMINLINPYVLESIGWRGGWVAISATSVAVALIAAVFMRSRPEDLGQHRDGIDPEEAVQQDQSVPALGESPRRAVLRKAVPHWTALEALRTPHFYILAIPTIVNSLVWAVFSAHGRLHMEDLGFTATAAGAILGIRVGISTFGRLTGSLGDFFSAARILGLSLIVSAAGMAGLLVAVNLPMAYLSVSLLGLGYGAGYIAGPVAFGDYFGRNAFAGSAGVRYTIIGIALWIGPSWAGAAADATGSYTASFGVLCGLALASAAAAFLVPHPGVGPARSTD